MKRFVSMLLLMSVFFTMFAAVGQAAEIVPKLFLNGKLLTSAVNPQIVNDTTVVPVRTISEGLGYPIEWDQANKTVTVNNGKDIIKLKLNDSVALVNGQPVQMDTPASIVKGTTLVPLRFIGEQFGLNFEWKQAEKEVHIFEIPKEPEETAQPAEPAGVISQISFDGISGVKITFAGKVKVNEPLYLDKGKKIVFDFPNATYAGEILASFKSGMIEESVADNPLLLKFRYSLFDNSPLISRLVLEVNEGTDFIKTESEGEIRLELLPASDAPVKPETPAEPPADAETPAIEPEKPAETVVYDIVIDAGHGGKDPGASSAQKKTEKDFNLSISLKIKALLDKEKKIKAHLTRSDDTFVELVDRVKFTEKLKADLFISIHSNAIDKSSVTGTETYYSRADSKAFADIMHKHMLIGTGLKDRGVRQANYKVIKQTTMPAILLEAGYLTNSGDAKALFSETVQNRIAAEIVAGIKEYLKLK